MPRERNILATEANQRAFYLSLIADTATYFELRETEEQIDLAQATLDSRREGLRIAQLRLDAGVTSALPYRQAETLLTSAEQQLARAATGAGATAQPVGGAGRGSIPTDLPGAMSLQSQGNAMILDAGTPSELLLVRLTLVAAEEQLRAARANIGAARARLFPDDFADRQRGLCLERPWRSVRIGWRHLVFGPTISLPIFGWGAREADLDLAKAREVEQVALYEKAVQTAFREVSDGLAGRRWLAQQVAAQEQGVAAQERIARLARRATAKAWRIISKCWMPSATCFCTAAIARLRSAPTCRTEPRCSLPSGRGLAR